jgi:NAD(P)H dehydrogenase (quinone)
MLYDILSDVGQQLNERHHAGQEVRVAETTFLITGATGATGGAATELLLDEKRRVRVLAHRKDDRSKRLEDLGAEVVYGDLLEFDVMRVALNGVQRAYFCYPIRPGIVQATAQFAQAAKEASVEFIVNMSQKSAREDAKSDAARQHWLAERVFDWSGVPTGHIRPTYFAEWLLYLAPMIRQGQMMAPFGTTGRHAPVAAEDQASVIVGMLEDPAPHKGKIYPLFGAVELTHPEIAATIGRVLKKDVKYQQVSIEEFAALYGGRPNQPAENPAVASRYSEPDMVTGRVENSYLMAHLREVAIDHHNGIFAGTNDAISKIGGRAPMTLEEFVEKHRAAFS